MFFELIIQSSKEFLDQLDQNSIKAKNVALQVSTQLQNQPLREEIFKKMKCSTFYLAFEEDFNKIYSPVLRIFDTITVCWYHICKFKSKLMITLNIYLSIVLWPKLNI